MASRISCNTYLSLSLNLDDDRNPNHHNTQQIKKNQLISRKFDHALPSLSLGLLSPKTSNISHSGITSYSHSKVKREREVIGEEEFAVDRDSSKREKDDHDEEFSVRKKLRLTKQQAIILEDSFKDHSTLNPKQKQELATQLGLRPRQVEVWFQNRRARTKLKQTELEYELMKKCLETLTDDNRRLRKELQELKTTKPTVPFYFQLSSAAVTMCPSCERIANSNISGNSHLHKIGAKSKFCSNFIHRSAAC